MLKQKDNMLRFIFLLLRQPDRKVSKEQLSLLIHVNRDENNGPASKQDKDHHCDQRHHGYEEDYEMSIDDDEAGDHLPNPDFEEGENVEHTYAARVTLKAIECKTKYAILS